MTSHSTLLFTRSDVVALLGLTECIDAVAKAFRLHAEGKIAPPGILGMHVEGGSFHIKAAAMPGAPSYFAAKTNANFPGNPNAHGLPTIQGAIVLCDGDTGAVLAILDSIEVTLRRTAAASALAARHLANADAATLAICGCGAQGRVQAEALAAIFPFKRAKVWDIDRASASAFALEMTSSLGLPFEATQSTVDATSTSDVVVTCTTSRAPFLNEGDVKPGAFIAAVGADNADKSEIAPALMRSSRVVVDTREQCLVMGDLHHAVAAGAMTAQDVHANLAEIITGARVGRSTSDEVFTFDSTGTALQDVASAALAYERAKERGIGLPFTLN
jgi:alanine dehydrogenase